MNLFDRLKEFKNTTWDGLDVQEIINLPDEERTALMRRISDKDMMSLHDEILEYSAWRDRVFAEAKRRGYDIHS